MSTESISIYGVKKCYASHKQYKGLIASHIKPYKLCVLEGDTISQFNINNGLLLAKHIDDYFDKLLITFDNEGRILCSNDIPNDVKDEFETYKLDALIYNDDRKRYMQIHRSLFFYKHYYGTSRLGYANLAKEKISIPFFDCGIRFYKSTFIIENNGVWTTCSTYKLKQVFVARTKYKFKYYISNADLATILLRTKEYVVPEDLPMALNCPSKSIDLFAKGCADVYVPFKISCTNFDLEEGIPEKFLLLLQEIFHYNKVAIQNFHSVVHTALLGKGYEKIIIFHGDIVSIDTLISIIQNVLGTYFYDYKGVKILYKAQKCNELPNCAILYFNNVSLIDNGVLNHIISGNLFPVTPLNVDKYTAFVKVNKSFRGEITNSIGFRFYKTPGMFDPMEIVQTEGGKILHWLCNGKPEGIDNCESAESYDAPMSNSTLSVDKWLTECCTRTRNINDEVFASLLYESYLGYSKYYDIVPVTGRVFFLHLSKMLPKKRRDLGFFMWEYNLTNQMIQITKGVLLQHAEK